MTARELLLPCEERVMRYSEWSKRLRVCTTFEMHLEEPVCGLRLARKHDVRTCMKNGYGYYCSWKLYLAARSSVPMGFSLKAWAEPSKQLCDNLC